MNEKIYSFEDAENMPSHSSWAEHLQAWLAKIRQLQSALPQLAIQPSRLQTQYLEVQQVYQTQITCLDVFDTHPKGQSIHTEIHRLLRLINTQFLFLQTARSLEKQQQQRRILCEHLSSVTQFIQLLHE